jgi:hypothetical protein
MVAGKVSVLTEARAVEVLAPLEGVFASVGERLWEAIHAAVRKHGLEQTPLWVGAGDLARVPILGEEFGEVCRALTYDQDSGKLELEVEDVAAVAVMWLMAKELERGQAAQGTGNARGSLPPFDGSDEGRGGSGAPPADAPAGASKDVT